jgi:hypothetical protein
MMTVVQPTSIKCVTLFVFKFNNADECENVAMPPHAKYVFSLCFHCTLSPIILIYKFNNDEKCNNVAQLPCIKYHLSKWVFFFNYRKHYMHSRALCNYISGTVKDNSREITTLEERLLKRKSKRVCK